MFFSIKYYLLHINNLNLKNTVLKTITMSKISFIILFASILLSGCKNSNQSNNTTEASIYYEIKMGNFSIADSLINIALNTDIPIEQKKQLKFEQERLRRVKLDFKRDEAYIKEKLAPTFPDLTDSQMRDWEKSKSLEMKIIDGERRYFNWAHRNLFRVNTEAKKHLQLDANQSDGITVFCQSYVPTMITELINNNTENSKTHNFEITYTLSTDSGVVKPGDTIRAWLPFPKPNNNRQFNIELIETSEKEYIVSPESNPHRSIYFEKVAASAKAQTFNIKYKVSTKGQWFGNQITRIETYNTESELYKHFTSERSPHIIFSDKMKHLTDSIVRNETQPYLIVKAIYNWIDDNIPWASAREYSTLLNIPEYVLENMHGDCGQQTLLFMTMARYKGIPTKWQSGWILIPGEVGLHDWAEVYYEGIGWVPVDQSFERINSEKEHVKYFYTCGIDPYRLIVNDDYSQEFYPTKRHFRSETVDFQRGEVETQDRNLYFNEWSYHMDVNYLD